ncbi:FUSC family protein [Terrabacter sp. NPDC080008]|uniref:FUSC family protein n=1 Tax=Terrabacter sp. NPDC080008 TaxID=3155176 RepID=UPI00344C7DC7
MMPRSHLFTFNRAGLHWGRGLLLLGVTLAPLVVLWVLGKEQYFLAAAFGVIFAAAADPGGRYAYRTSHLTVFVLAGALVTAIGFAMGASAWGWKTLAAFTVTLAAGLAALYGAHRYIAADMLNVWFIVALALASGYVASNTDSPTWAQAVAWTAGSVLWLAVAFLGWLAHRRKERPQPIAELPGDISRRKLTAPLATFAVIRAVAIAITVAIAFGLGLDHADWMPIAAIVAMKPSLEEARTTSEQRLAGAFIGAVLAAVLLSTVANQRALEILIVVCLALGFAVRFANYALYCAAIATAVLLALDLPNPGDLTSEVQRVLFTFLGLAIALIVLVLAGLLAKRKA